VIIGGAFGKIVGSMVDDIIMPMVSLVFGKLDFSNYYLPLAGQDTSLALVEAKKQGAVLAFGNFFSIALNFAILAFVIFVMIRQINRMKSQPEAAPAEPTPTPEDIALLREIRDSLKQRG